MSEFIRIKQVEGLSVALNDKAANADVLKKSNNLSDVTASTARTNLDVFSKGEVNALVAGVDNAHSVGTIAQRDALTGLKVTDRVFVSDDGDGKWALYIVTAVTTGTGATSTFEKISDKDLLNNALSAAGIKAAYESNSNTNAYTDAEKAKVGHLTVTQAVNLDTMESTLVTTTTTANTALTTANQGVTAAAAAAATAEDAMIEVYNLQSSKEDLFTHAVQTFTNLTGAANTSITVTVQNNIASGFTPEVYFNGVRVKTVTFTPGTKNVSFQVPYLTETTDDVMVSYNWR